MSCEHGIHYNLYELVNKYTSVWACEHGYPLLHVIMCARLWVHEQNCMHHLSYNRVWACEQCTTISVCTGRWIPTTLRLWACEYEHQCTADQLLHTSLSLWTWYPLLISYSVRGCANLWAYELVCITCMWACDNGTSTTLDVPVQR